MSHHPPVASMNCQGEGWELMKSLQTFIKFTGKQVQVTDIYPTVVYLSPLHMNGKRERYHFSTPKMTIGNLVVGEKYIEPAGVIHVYNDLNGNVCEMNFKAR